MSILTKVEAKSTRGRLFQTGVLVALLLGGVTMVYPFLLMISGAMRSELDTGDMSIVPPFLHDDEVLVRKFLETKYNYSVTEMNLALQTQTYTFAAVGDAVPVDPDVLQDFEAFAKQVLPRDHWQILGGALRYKSIRSEVYDQLLSRLQRRYHNDIDAFNEDLGSPLASWRQFSFPTPSFGQNRTDFDRTPVHDEYFALLRDLPTAYRSYVNLSSLFLQEIVYPSYTQSGLEKYNANHVRKLASFSDFRITPRVPGKDEPEFRNEWLSFALGICGLSFVRSDAGDDAYRHFLRQNYLGIEQLNQARGSNYRSFEELRLPADDEWVQTSDRQDYLAFLRTLPPESLRLVGPEFTWQAMLRERYKTIHALNEAHGTAYADWIECPIPLKQVVQEYVLSHASELRWRYAFRNFKIVLQEIVVEGRALYNTIIYVSLALLFSLTLQPLVAYSLSRFNPPGTWKIIFIFMATMAFPPMVSLIPKFLILRELGLLNTFVGLVLPVTISGYSIFMLKGFFDSIPQNLYEAATIDGASELTIFWEVAMSLSKPILAVVALSTFGHAWTAFMYPLIVCSDPQMHVLAVWLHQFQQDAPSSAVFASILVASVPTLLVFMISQRTIMRGIAVPSEK